jgi:CheY-like chemotaxis protein
MIRRTGIRSAENDTSSIRDADLSQSGSILVVDDDREIRELMEAILSKAGYAVAVAADGDEALRLMRSIRPSLIFLDINMPIMDGAEFRQAQRRDPDLIRIPTVVMTAANTEPLLDLAVEETLRKPVHCDDLMRIVRRHCTPTLLAHE